MPYIKVAGACLMNDCDCAWRDGTRVKDAMYPQGAHPPPFHKDCTCLITGYEPGEPRITQVEVMIHEKRSHPYEYGNYDTEYRLTAQIRDGEEADVVLYDLTQQAAKLVKRECDRWVAETRIDHLARANAGKDPQ